MEKDNLVIQPSLSFSAAPQTGKGSDQNLFNFDAFEGLSEEEFFVIMGGQDDIVYDIFDNQTMAPSGNLSFDMEFGIEPGLTLNANHGLLGPNQS